MLWGVRKFRFDTDLGDQSLYRTEQSKYCDQVIHVAWFWTYIVTESELLLMSSVPWCKAANGWTSTVSSRTVTGCLACSRQTNAAGILFPFFFNLVYLGNLFSVIVSATDAINGF